MRKTLFMLFGIVLVLCAGEAQAGDVEDVIATRDASIAAWNAGDVDAILKHYAPGYTFYDDSGNLLNGVWQSAGLKAWFEEGATVVVSRIQNTEVQVHGDTAVTTGYVRVVSTQPDGESRTTTRRSTGVYVKKDGQWKGVHSHWSLLTPTQE